MTDARGGVYVGLMSGTSLDGISAAVVRLRATESAHVDAQLLAWSTVPYAAAQRDRIAKAMIGGTAEEYCRLAFDFGTWLANAAVAVIGEAGVPRQDICAIGSHGQTLWHDPPRSTWQIGEAAVIAERTGIDVVSDFRVGDLAAGGQGAPLVPIADALLFSAPDAWRALQNLGGIGNVSVVPPGGDLSGVRAFDTGPGVVVIDAVTRMLVPSMPYDIDGELSASGTPIAGVVSELLRAPYFNMSPPKSTGRELFDGAYATGLIAMSRARNAEASTADIVATATALTAESIADAYRRFLPEPVEELLVSGGGARNPTLVRMIEQALSGLPVRRFADVFFDGDAKEAVAFALLAFLHVEGRAGNVPAATGARGGRVLGKRTMSATLSRGRPG